MTTVIGADVGLDDDTTEEAVGLRRSLAFAAVSLGAFGVPGATLIALVFGLVLAIAMAREALVERLRSGAPAVKRWGGGLLLLVGVWMLSLAAFADFFRGIFPV